MKAFTEGNVPEMRKCLKKPIPVEACQMDDQFYVDTSGIRISGKAGDYLMRGVEGELYVCSRAVFEKTYTFLD